MTSVVFKLLDKITIKKIIICYYQLHLFLLYRHLHYCSLWKEEINTFIIEKLQDILTYLESDEGGESISTHVH